MSFDNAKFTLYTYFRSSCSARVRTAAALKGIPLSYKYVNLLKGEQSADAYVSDVNASGTVPTLIVELADGSRLRIRQSIAILEFFEEAFPPTAATTNAAAAPGSSSSSSSSFPSPRQVALLPPPDQPGRRALVRDLVTILSADFQSRTNLCVLRRVAELGVTAADWCREYMPPALAAAEAVLRESAGRFCVGDEVTLADVVLAPAVEGALRWGVDFAPFPEVKRVYDTVRELPAFVAADWRHQEDTPEDLRAS
ncbi:glutathione S-transferase [Xylariales sp. PMI_506]|nr:glutathione S-transferase [Xylariales sp. PMI_506]